MITAALTPIKGNANQAAHHIALQWAERQYTLLRTHCQQSLRAGGGLNELSLRCQTHHEGIRALVVKLRPLPKVVKNARLVNVVQRRHIRHHLRVLWVRLPQALVNTSRETG